MNYDQALDYLRGLQWFGARFGLETTRQLSRYFGDPSDGLRFIHVAGTNGKGSTCAMLDAIYRRAGLTVGLYTSPHLIRFSERIQVNGAPIPDDALAQLIAEFRGAVERASLPGPPTFFEAATILALLWFRISKCDLVIWETGLGGRLDATNIVSPLASVITNIQFDHERWLGHTLAQIATEKAGIIKPFRPAITGCDDGEALDVIASAARAKGASLTVARHPGPWTDRCSDVRLTLAGEHQWRNAAVALAAVETLQEVMPVKLDAIRDGLANVRWPGRFQLISNPRRNRYLLDGAHNPAGAQTLRRALEQYFPGQSLHLVLGAMEDKDWKSMCAILAPLAHAISIVPVASARTASVISLMEVCRSEMPGSKVDSFPSVTAAIDAIDTACADSLVAVTGSLHLVGEALEHLTLPTSAAGCERALNDWTAPRPPQANVPIR